MPTPTQVPTIPQTQSAERPCFWCNGGSRIPNDDEQRYDDCDMCEGSGSRPVVLVTEPVAA